LNALQVGIPIGWICEAADRNDSILFVVKLEDRRRQPPG